jgi:hypothetical protein
MPYASIQATSLSSASDWALCICALISDSSHLPSALRMASKRTLEDAQNASLAVFLRSEASGVRFSSDLSFKFASATANVRNSVRSVFKSQSLIGLSFMLRLMSPIRNVQSSMRRCGYSVMFMRNASLISGSESDKRFAVHVFKDAVFDLQGFTLDDEPIALEGDRSNIGRVQSLNLGLARMFRIKWALFVKSYLHGAIKPTIARCGMRLRALQYLGTVVATLPADGLAGVMRLLPATRTQC